MKARLKEATYRGFEMCARQSAKFKKGGLRASFLKNML